MPAHTYSKSFENSRDSWNSMPNSRDENRDSIIELQSIEQGDAVEDLKSSWRSLFVFTTRKHAFTVTVALIATISSSLVKAGAAIFFGNIFNDLTRYGAGTVTIQVTVQQISKWCFALVMLGLAAWVTEGLFLSQWMVFGELQAKSVREQMFTGLLEKDMAWYDLRKDGTSTLLIRIQTQIRELQLSVSQPMGCLVYEVSAALSSIGLAFYYSWNLTLVILVAFPIAAFALWLVSRNLAPAVEAQKRDLTLASKYANTAITSINTVKAFNGQDHELWQYYVTIKDVAHNYLIQARANAMQFGIIKFFTVGIFVSGFWYGVVLVRGGLNPGSVVTTFYACLTAMQSIEIVLPQWLVLTKGMSAGETLKSILSQIKNTGRKESLHGTLKPESCSGDIEINGISFAYPSNPTQDVISNNTYFFPAGETSYVVGRSGSGKSTLSNLLLRYYEPTSGEIIIDGHNINELDTDWLRENITLVQQQSVLFNETVFQNIAFGTHGIATNAEIYEATKTADLEQTISDLPNGLDTPVGSNGKSLSGGQQQRIALARARLRDAPIVILDEATSALDHTSRDKVNKLIREWRKGKTTIVITHDVSQIQDDEYVYVLESGMVVQEGYRSKLAEKTHGTFASFLPVQNNKPRRFSEPISSVSPILESPEEETSQRWNHLSAVFGMYDTPSLMGSGRFGGLPGNRMSIGLGSVQANDLRADAIWSSPAIPNERAKFLSATPRSIPKPFVSPRLTSESDSPISSPEVDAYLQNTPSPPPPVFTNSFRLPAGGEPLTIDTRVNDEREHEPVRLGSIHTITPADNNPHAPKPTTLRYIFSSIWPTLSPKEKVVLVLGFIAAFIVAASTPAFAYIFARLLAVFYITKNQAAEAQKYSLILIGIAIVDGVCSFCYHYALEYCGQAWVNALRVEALKRILAQPRSWFDKEKNSASRLNECLDRNAEEMRNLIGRFAGPVWVAFWMLTISVVWSFTISWRLTLVALAAASSMYLATRLFDFVSTKWEEKGNQASDNASTIFTETFANIRVVRALTLEKYFNNKHTLATKETYNIGKSRALYSGILFGLTDCISFCISALVFYYGTILFSEKNLTIDQVLQVIQLLLFGIANASAVIIFIPQINISRTTATQMLRLARLPLKSHESTGTSRLETPFPITFQNLSFTYPSRPNTKTLSNINLTLNPGTCTALVGPSGSGKSTIASILLALYPPDTHVPRQSPSLTFNNIPIENCHTASLRTHISIVPQAPTLFPTTVLANITYGLVETSPFATPASAISAAKEAGIHDFIMSLEHGYRTLIGEGGMGVSGGQAQRIAIARALVRKPRVLVLDEATSALDAVSAEAVRETMRNLLREGEGREMAVLVISHGVEMMRAASEVVVVEGGRVVERGAFEELRCQGGGLASLIGERVEGGGGRRLGVEEREMTPVKPRGRGERSESL